MDSEYNQTPDDLGHRAKKIARSQSLSALSIYLEKWSQLDTTLQFEEYTQYAAVSTVDPVIRKVR